MNFNHNKLAKDILNKRTKDDLSFRAIEIATKGKLNKTTLQRIEDKTQEPKASTLADICTWLNVPVQNYF